MTTNEIVGRLRDGGLDASSTNRSAAVYVAEAMEGRATAGWFAFRIIYDSDATERRARAILSRWYDIETSGNVWRLKSKNRIPLMAIKRGAAPSTNGYMYLEAAQANSTVSMVSTLTTAPSLEYSTDGVTWQEWQHTTADGTHTFDTITLGAIGDRVYFRGDNPDGLAFFPEGAETPNFSNFVLTGAVKGGGNVMSLLDKTMELTEVPDFGFMSLFIIMGEDVEPALLIPPSMDTITTIGDYGCNSMYDGCTSLTAAADMPSLTTIGDNGCIGMYFGCTSLTSAAAMPAVTTIGDNGCNIMYGGCTSLTSAADMPAVATIGDHGCNGMYGGCTSLTSAADMPAVATIGDHGCNIMYRGCTSLTAAADMPSLTTIGDHGCNGMYGGCTSLTSAAAMPAVTTIGDYGCSEMYRGCTSLTAAADMPSLTTIGDNGCIGMYFGCTSLTSAAAMPAVTTIGDYGCSEMYRGCTSLTAAADMPAVTTIGGKGCKSMYFGCTFNMSNDGTTLNFDFPTPPITAGETTYSTAYDVAQWMGNTNGFGGDNQ